MRRKTASGHYVGQEFWAQKYQTNLVTLLIRKINEDDVNLTPYEQMLAIRKLTGLPTEKMESLIMVTGPALASTIRKLISPGRATNRTTKRRAQAKRRALTKKRISSKRVIKKTSR